MAGPDSPVCSFFLKGICKFGFVGRGCKDQHPKHCKVFRAWGSSGEKSCRGGKNCQNGSHPLMCKNSMLKLRCDNVDCSAKLHASKCVREKPGLPGPKVNTGGCDGHGTARGDRGRGDSAGPRDAGHWPKDRSVWEYEDRSFRERHRPHAGHPPELEDLRREILAQQQEFQEQMMVRMEQMLGRVHGGGGMWLGRPPSKY